MIKHLKKHIAFVVLSLLLLAFLVLIGPMNAFQHGYYANEVDVTTILNDDLTGTYDLTNGEYTATFIPAKKHMAGVEVYIQKQDSTQGNLILTVEDNSGKVIDRSEVDVSKIKPETWYKFYTRGKYQIGSQYTLHINASGINGSITLQKATSSYMPEENKVGEVLLSFAYKKATFNHEAGILICAYEPGMKSICSPGGSATLNSLIKLLTLLLEITVHSHSFTLRISSLTLMERSPFTFVWHPKRQCSLISFLEK